MRHIIPISGKDSCATALVQMERAPSFQYELFFNDVGAELPETYSWLDEVEKKLGRKITRVGESLEKIILHYGILPSAHVRFCTREAKIEPMEEWIGKDEVTIYFGIRADEQRAGYEPKKNIHPIYPLREEGITLEGVFAILNKWGLRPPKFFWKSLHEIVLGKLEVRERRQGTFFSRPPPRLLLSSPPEWVFDQLFAWRTRSNCSWCFFQRKYEWAGLLEHHPDLFSKAQELEEKLGNDRQRKPFTWIAGEPLSYIRRTADSIREKRAVQVIEGLDSMSMKKDPADLLSVTSCGLLCGK